MVSRGLRQFVWILVWKQINGWLKNGASQGVVCGCTGVHRAGQPREHGSEGCPRSHMDRPPLRSDRWPDGVPSLSGINLVRVRLSNRLYAFMARLIPKLDANNVVWTVENPWTSLLWKTSYWRRIAKLKPWYCELHNCMFGGSRLKRTCIASSCGAVMALAIKMRWTTYSCTVACQRRCFRHFIGGGIHAGSCKGFSTVCARVHRRRVQTSKHSAVQQNG